MQHTKPDTLVLPLFCSAEQLLKQILPAYLQVAGNVSQDGRQGSDPKRIVGGNCKVVLRGNFESKTKMAAGLSCDPVADSG